MTGYLLRRLGQAVVVVIGVSIVVFVLSHLLPGGEARAVLGQRATAAQIAAFNKAQGLDLSLPAQYGHYLWQLLHGNLGYSYQYNQSVNSLLAEDLPKSLVLFGAAVILAVVIAVPLGIFQAIRRNKLSDYLLTGASFLAYSMPTFWLGLLLITGFAVDFHLFRAEGPQGNVGADFSHPGAMVLPVATLTLVTIAQFSRYTRSAALDNLAQDYIRTARAKGLPERAVLTRHLLRNSLIPIITLLGAYLPIIFSGALVTEVVFNYPGVGLLFFNAAVTKDYPVMLGTVLFVSVAAVVGSLLADICYAIADPRVRLA
ncbi:MAG: ABC transporter permease [Acidimicrobiales bacterium]